MVSAAQRRQHERWLLELTGVPTAAGREHRVVQWIRRWVAARRGLRLETDPAGNLLITRPGRQPARSVFMTAHLDHPAFVVRKVPDKRTLELEFRGGVHEPYFQDAALEIFDAADRRHRAVVRSLDGRARPFKRVQATMGRSSSAIAPGDVGRWALRGRGARPEVRQGILYAPACDDLAGVAAALSTLDVLRKRAAGAGIGVLLTVAEEVGFIGAIASCKHGTVPRSASLICLENSRSFPESPIGSGPILRVGDRLSVFSPQLTNRIGMLLQEHEKRHPEFRYQRRLMPGGTCEATTFATYGYRSTCICLPLGNYHNMRDIDGVLAGGRPARVGAEYISMSDYHGMIELLVVCAPSVGGDGEAVLRPRMEKLYRQYGRYVLNQGLRD